MKRQRESRPRSETATTYLSVLQSLYDLSQELDEEKKIDIYQFLRDKKVSISIASELKKMHKIDERNRLLLPPDINLVKEVIYKSRQAAKASYNSPKKSKIGKKDIESSLFRIVRAVKNGDNVKTIKHKINMPECFWNSLEHLNILNEKNGDYILNNITVFSVDVSDKILQTIKNKPWEVKNKFPISINTRLDYNFVTKEELNKTIYDILDSFFTKKGIM